MNARVLSLAAALALTTGFAAAAQPAIGPAQGQTETPASAANAVGHWLYDTNGRIVGSVRGLTDGGQTAIIMVGVYYEPGSHETTIPSSALVTRNGKLTLETSTVQALNTRTAH